MEHPCWRSLLQSLLQEVTSHSVGLWPPVPYRAFVPQRRALYILVTQNDQKTYDDGVRKLTNLVCTQMIKWLGKLPQASKVTERHWEKRSYGEEHAAEFSIFMHLAPLDFPEGGPNYLLREDAYFALEEFRNLINVYGPMQGEFEIWSSETKRSTCTIYVVQWPVRKDKSQQ